MESATSGYTKRLQGGIRRQHGCESKHLESVPLEIQQDGKTIWKGVVELFRLSNGPARFCYAWAFAQRGDSYQNEVIVVFADPAVNSPRKAVESYLASEKETDQPF